MKYFGTITGLTPAATAPAYLPQAEEQQGPNYLGLALLCIAGTVICAIIVYVVGRKRGR